jgi:TatD DNase family protein
MSLIETHCHLTFPPLADNLSAVSARAKARGVLKILVPSYDVASWAPVARAAELKGVYPAFGVHPWVADQPLDIDALQKRLVDCKAAAVGEIGLDFKTEVPRVRQIAVLRQQLECAAALDLPVLLHVRGAFEEMLDILKCMSPRPAGVVHAFSRGPELARRFLDLGFHIAFGGAITRPGAVRARRAAVSVPAERLLLETDAPSIGLEGVRPEDTEPFHIADIAACAASLRGESFEDIARITTQNAERLFRL